jgi:Na+-transporting NADH:ubiquinone oxidoreductase subunit C
VSAKAYTVAYAMLIAAVFAALVAAVNAATRDRAARHRAAAREEVILRVLGLEPPAGSSAELVTAAYRQRVRETGVTLRGPTGRRPVYAGYSPDGVLVGYAFELVGQGFWDRIRGYVGISPDLRTILGIGFHEQHETPGLGAEITSPWFQGQFAGKHLPEHAAADGRLIVFRGPGEETGPNEVHAVTGATGTSRAVERLTNETLTLLLAAMREHGADG